MIDENRIPALAVAARVHELLGDITLRVGEDRAVTVARVETEIRESAEVFLAWLRGPSRLKVEFGPIVNQNTKLPTGNINAGGSAMQLHDNEQCDVTVSAVDAKGFESADVLTYVSADETIVTVVGATDEDSHTATLVAGVPGSTTVTLTDPTAIDPVTSAPIFATIAVDVVAAGAVTINVVEGTPVPQA